MMLWGGANGSELELRKGRGKSRRLKGKFPYRKRAVLSDGGKNGRPKKEEFEARAFAYRIEKKDEDIHLLIGHSYDQPLASRAAGTMDVTDGDDAVRFDAEIVPDMAETSWAQDFFRSFASGLVGGISPGFRIPPPITVPDAERVTEEDPRLGRALIRTILQALLYEFSLVTVPAYKETEVEERNWELTDGGVILPDQGANLHFEGLAVLPGHPLNRWRL